MAYDVSSATFNPAGSATQLQIKTVNTNELIEACETVTFLSSAEKLLHSACSVVSK